MKKFLFLIFFVLFGLCPAFAYDYTIDAYDVNMSVSENRTFDITEKITAFFNVPKHGIYRTIPLHETMIRADGTRNAYSANIEDISVNEQFKKSITMGKYLMIKIGSPDATLSGKKEYVIKYKYFMGNDPLKDKDEFYFNIIGDSWDTQIKNVTFAIKLPKDFDASKVGFSAGVHGSGATDKLVYEIKNNTILGMYNGVLAPKEALTIRIELPEGYFINKTAFDFTALLFLAPLIFLIISYFMWFHYGRDAKAFEVLDFYPPDNINPVEMSYIYYQNITPKDVSTLLIYLASKGYIGIEETQHGNKILEVFNVKDYTIKKIKPYDGSNTAENLFMQTLFSQSDTVKLSEIASNTNLYKIVDKIKKSICNSDNLFEKSSMMQQIAIAVFMVISLLLINFAYAFKVGMPEMSTFFSLPVLIIYILIVHPVIRFFCTGSFKAARYNILVIIFFSIFLGAAFYNLMPLDFTYLSYYLFGILCVVLMNIVYFYMPKWTQEGHHLYCRILGFRKYLQKAEIQRLQALVDKDPQYFYKILPFAYVLGLSKKWMKKFEHITSEPPSYFYGAYNYKSFTSSITNIVNTTTTSCAPPSSRGGIGSGGGCSGGGGGGGGGGSW